MRVDIEEGKYTYVFNGGDAHVLRYGEEWRDVVGDKFIYCMAAEIEALRKELASERESALSYRDEAIAAQKELSDLKASLGEPVMRVRVRGGRPHYAVAILCTNKPPVGEFDVYALKDKP